MLRILLAEDSAVVILGLKISIDKEADITVVDDAANGEEAFSKFERTEVNIVVTDINMPKVDGFGLIEKLKQRKPY